MAKLISALSWVVVSGASLFGIAILGISLIGIVSSVRQISSAEWLTLFLGIGLALVVWAVLQGIVWVLDSVTGSRGDKAALL